MPFLTDDVSVAIDPTGTYRLTAPLVYKGRDDTFTVPTGTATDLASVPRCLTWLVPIAGVHDRAAIVHDYLCRELAEFHRDESMWMPNDVTAVDTDGIFRRILRELGVPLVRRWLMWTGVRLGALANPARRPGWIKTAPAVIGISLLALPLILPATVAVLAVLAVDRIVEKVR